jgi:hypothetical protein
LLPAFALRTSARQAAVALLPAGTLSAHWYCARDLDFEDMVATSFRDFGTILTIGLYSVKI